MTKTEEIFLMILKNSLHTEKILPAELESISMDEDIDWKSILDIAQKQNLFPFIYDAATAFPAFSDFDSANSQYFVFATADISAQMQRTEAFLSLYKALRNNNLEPIAIKGIICRSLYGERADLRPSGDEDILIEKQEYKIAEKVLESCGYQKLADPDKDMAVIQEVTFQSEDLMLELHLNPFGTDSTTRERMNDWFRDVFRNYEIVDIKGVQVKTMTPTDHFLFLVFHAFKHFTGGGFGVRMMLDILLFAEKYTDRIDWSYVSKGLADVGATGFLSDLVEIGNRYLGFNFSQQMEPVCPDELLDDMFRMGIFGNTDSVDQTAGRMVADNVQKHGKAHENKWKSYFRLLFPSWKNWCAWKPYLKDRPWMVVPEWFSRISRYRRGETFTSDIKDLDKSFQIASERMQLLEKYGVL